MPAPGPTGVDGAAARGYAGDVTAAEAWQLASTGRAVIVDVRTGEEWYWVGRVPGAEHIEWALATLARRQDEENKKTRLLIRCIEKGLSDHA